MYKLLVKGIFSFVLSVVAAFSNLMLIGDSGCLWLNILNAGGFILGIIGAVVAYKSVIRIAKIMDAEKYINDKTNFHIVTDMIHLHKKGIFKNEDEDDEHAYCADFK